MFRDKINWAMRSRGFDVEAFDSLMREEPFISDNVIFDASRFINSFYLPIFLTKKIGDMEIRCRRFDIAVVYNIRTSTPCNVIVDFNDLSLTVEYGDVRLTIDQNLSDYRGEHTKLYDLRQTFLNEILIRYFSIILYAMYRELRWYEQ